MSVPAQLQEDDDQSSLDHERPDQAPAVHVPPVQRRPDHAGSAHVLLALHGVLFDQDAAAHVRPAQDVPVQPSPASR